MRCLPEEFYHRMKELLGAQFDAFCACYESEPQRALRVNLLKISIQKFKKCFPHALKETPFSKESFVVDDSFSNPGRHPLHHAGAFYMQEPSAASAVTALSPGPGDRVLDLCAAPGGKSTQIASALEGQGLLWSNEIVPKRAKILLSNIERMGVKNAVVSACRPDVLCVRLKGFFDKILVDAPCSGEGMFRRDEQAVSDWSVEHVKACAARQLSILRSAKEALRPGGVLVYSTCTFSMEENEGVVAAFLKENPEFMLEEIKAGFGRPGFAGIGGVIETDKTRRIFPMDGGEGHFVARLRKTGGEQTAPPLYRAGRLDPATAGLCERLWRDIFTTSMDTVPVLAGESLLLLPDGLPDCRGLTILRAGLLLGVLRKNRVEPAHALFMAARAGELCQALNFSAESEEIQRFLRGEEIPVPQGTKGYTGVAVEGVVTGFGKASNGVLKNHYPKGLRNL